MFHCMLCAVLSFPTIQAIGASPRRGLIPVEGHVLYHVARVDISYNSSSILV